MPAMNPPWETTELIESTAVSFTSSQESTVLHAGSLQNPTEWRCDSPFFGSVLSVSSVMHLQSGMAVTRRQRSRVGTSRIRNIVIVDLCPSQIQANVSGCAYVGKFVSVTRRVLNSHG